VFFALEEDKCFDRQGLTSAFTHPHLPINKLKEESESGFHASFSYAMDLGQGFILLDAN